MINDNQRTAPEQTLRDYVDRRFDKTLFQYRKPPFIDGSGAVVVMDRRNTPERRAVC